MSYRLSVKDFQLKKTGASDISTLKILTGTSGTSQIYLGDTAVENVGLIKYNHLTDTFSINTSSAERLTILSTGNVGINTNSPAAKLHVENATNTGTATDNCELLVKSSNRTGFISLDGASTGTPSVIFKNAGIEKSRILYNNTSDYLTISTATIERLRIDSVGRVSVGTTAPDTANTYLMLSSAGETRQEIRTTNTGNTTQLIFNNTGGVKKARIGMETNDSGGGAFSDGVGAYALVLSTDSTQDIALRTNDTTRMIVDSTGNVGIGITTTSNKLHVVGASEIFKVSDGTRNVVIGCDVNEPWFGTSTNNTLRIVTNNLERMRIDSAGRIKGSSAIHRAAAAQDTSGTSQYYIESGTYTPTFSSNTGFTTFSTTYAVNWLRVANVVTVSGQVDLSGITANTACTFLMTTPVESPSGFNNRSIGGFCGSSGTSLTVGGSPGGVLEGGAPPYKLALCNFTSGTSSTSRCGFHFTYTIN